MSGIAAQRSVSFDTLAQSALPGSFDAHETGVKTTNKITDGPTMHLTFCEKFESKIIAPSAERRAPSAERRAPSAMTAPLAQAGRCPSSPPDRRPPVRGGGASPSPYTYTSAAGRPAGPARLCRARRGLARSARTLAAAALLAHCGALALPAQAQAQSVTTLVSNIGQGSTATSPASVQHAQRFTTDPHGTGYTLSSVDVVSADAEGTLFSAKVCTVNASGYPTSTCTDLADPASFAAGTITFTAPANTVLAPATTYTVVLTTLSEGDVEVTYGYTTADGEDAGLADGWSIADVFDWWNIHASPPSPTSATQP